MPEKVYTPEEIVEHRYLPFKNVEVIVRKMRGGELPGRKVGGVWSMLESELIAVQNGTWTPQKKNTLQTPENPPDPAK